MTEADDRSSSTVADEAVRLAAALAALTTPPPGPEAGKGQADQDTTGADDDARSAGAANPSATDEDGPACSCGNASVQAICDICPVCRVAAFLSEVRPETVERVADLLSMVVGSLEAFAAQRRTEMAGSETPDPAGPQATPGEHPRWQPVDVEGEDT